MIMLSAIIAAVGLFLLFNGLKVGTKPWPFDDGWGHDVVGGLILCLIAVLVWVAA